MFSMFFNNYTRKGFNENRDYACRTMSIKCQHSCIFAYLFVPQQEALEMEYFIQKLVSCKCYCYMFMIGNLKITCLPK